MDPIATWALAIAVVLILFAVFILIFRWISNCTVPAVFALKEITLWQAIGILVPASILTVGRRILTTDLTANFPKRS